MAFNHVKWIVYGLDSFEPANCKPYGKPGIYVKIAPLLPWIVAQLKP